MEEAAQNRPTPTSNALAPNTFLPSLKTGFGDTSTSDGSEGEVRSDLLGFNAKRPRQMKDEERCNGASDPFAPCTVYARKQIAPRERPDDVSAFCKLNGKNHPQPRVARPRKGSCTTHITPSELQPLGIPTVQCVAFGCGSLCMRDTAHRSALCTLRSALCTLPCTTAAHRATDSNHTLALLFPFGSDSGKLGSAHAMHFSTLFGCHPACLA